MENLSGASVLVGRTATHTNREAYLLLGMLVERVGMRRAEFLARLAGRGYEVSDTTFANWGRPGRAFPRDWPLLQAMISILSDPTDAHRCTAAEALRFLVLTEMPFAELGALAGLFPSDELGKALANYIPPEIVVWLGSAACAHALGGQQNAASVPHHK